MESLEDLGFNEILQAAESLTAEIESSNELPRVQRNLRQVLEAGQTLLERTSRDVPHANAETKASIFLGTKGVDITRLSQKLEPLYMSTNSLEPIEPASEVDIEGFLKGERMNSLCAIVESTSNNLLAQLEEKIWENMDEDWKIEKERMMNMLSGNFRVLDFEKKPIYGREMDSSSILSSAELTYAHEINQYNQAVIHNLPKPNLLERFELAAKNTGDKNIQEMWASIVAMTSSLPYEPSNSLIDKRSSVPFVKTLISRARRYLEKSFFAKLQNDVWSNLANSRLGGVPALIPLVQSYLSIKGLTNAPGLEIGSGDSGPIWAVVYLCLRCGKISDAAKFMRDSVGNTEIAKYLDEYEASGSTNLSIDAETKVRLEYRRVFKNSSRDPFKRIVYCILGACDVSDDHSEVATRLDDYLWLKLSQIRDNSENRYSTDYITYSAFQSIISEKYGEVHFDAFKQPYVYFQALILTGQFENAIEFMSRISSLRSDAVHVAIVLNENLLLLTTDAKSPLLIRIEDDPPGLRRLNFCHLIISFAKTLQTLHTKDALNYLYFLRNMKDIDGADLFSVCVSELVTDSRDFDLFGAMNLDGCRTPGILETLGIDVQPIIVFCAAESENNGLLEDAVTLYDLAGKHEEALKVLIRVTAQHLSDYPEPNSPRQRIQRIAISLAERYQRQPPNIVDKSIASTFYILVDFMTFFDEVFGKRFENGLVIIDKMGVIPLNLDDVERSVTNFHSFADEIRMNIPDLILATMESLLHKYKKLKVERKSNNLAANMGNSDNQFLLDVKEKAKALVSYCGRIPYFMTGDVYSKVMQFEVQMS